MKYNYYMGDFETTVYKGQERTDVWAAALVPFYTEDVKIYHSIDEMFEGLTDLPGNIVVYFHNLKFDGSFWLNFLMNNSDWKQAFEGDFAKYLEEGKEVKIIITGSADASRILNTKPYDERYGKYVDEPFYKDGNLSNITVTKESGISTNEQLALMRAAGVHHYIVNNINTLKNTKNSYEYHVEVAKEKGGEFRRINVEFVIVDAFPQK